MISGGDPAESNSPKRVRTGFWRTRVCLEEGCMKFGWRFPRKWEIQIECMGFGEGWHCTNKVFPAFPLL